MTKTNSTTDNVGFEFPDLSDSKEAKDAIGRIDGFFNEYEFSEDEQDLFYQACMGSAAAALDGQEDPPMMDLRLMAYICNNRDVETAEIGRQIENFCVLLKEMAEQSEQQLPEVAVPA